MLQGIFFKFLNLVIIKPIIKPIGRLLGKLIKKNFEKKKHLLLHVPIINGILASIFKIYVKNENSKKNYLKWARSDWGTYSAYVLKMTHYYAKVFISYRRPIIKALFLSDWPIYIYYFIIEHLSIRLYIYNLIYLLPALLGGSYSFWDSAFVQSWIERYRLSYSIPAYIGDLYLLIHNYFFYFFDDPELEIERHSRRFLIKKYKRIYDFFQMLFYKCVFVLLPVNKFFFKIFSTNNIFLSKLKFRYSKLKKKIINKLFKGYSFRFESKNYVIMHKKRRRWKNRRIKRLRRERQNAENNKEET